MTVEIPQADALRLYLAMVAGREPAGSMFEIRSRRVTGNGFAQDFVPIGDAERAARAIVNRGQVTDTYVGVAPRVRRSGGLDAIERAWCLWADCDTPEAVRALAEFRPLPSVVIRSGTPGHVHAYWPLRSAVSAGWVKRANRRLALAVGGDRNATDAARIMRPPASFNWKGGGRRAVICTRLEPVVFELGDVVGRLADDVDYGPPTVDRQRVVDQVGVRGLAGLVRTVHDAQNGNRNCALHWAACRLAESELADDPDARGQVLQAALDAGLDEAEAARTMRSALARRAA